MTYFTSSKRRSGLTMLMIFSLCFADTDPAVVEHVLKKIGNCGGMGVVS